jgi:hypothetical protein
MLRCTLLMALVAISIRASAEEATPFVIIPGEVPPYGRIPPYEPAPPPLPEPRSVPVQQAPPPSATGFAPGLPPAPQGPVTNYGTGGMQALPGAPPNPPYPPAGLMH